MSSLESHAEELSRLDGLVSQLEATDTTHNLRRGYQETNQRYETSKNMCRVI